jgi:hypothetical protein
MKRIIDKRAGMEGIPLQLIIVVVVGMAALGILIGWLAMADDTDPTLKRIATEPETIEISGDGRITMEVAVEVFVYDSEGDEVDDVAVTFTGSVDDRVVEKIDSGDMVTIVAALAPGQDTATIDVEAEKGGGMGSTSTTILVMRD